MATRTPRRRKNKNGKIIAFVAVALVICIAAVVAIKNRAVSTGNVDSAVVQAETAANGDGTVSGLTGSYAEYADTIRATYSRTDSIEYILNNIDKYPESLLETLTLKPEMVDFIAGYPTHEQYGFNNCKNIDVSADYTKGEIPLFIQWDSRWGYETYGSDLVALNACGPTCFAMVYVGLTGDTSVNPLTIAKMCIEQNYYYYGSGTGRELFDSGVSKYGLSSKKLTATASAVTASLEAGRPVVVNVGPGDFTSIGHYIVLTGIADNGEIKVNDPNSPIKSSMTWELDRILKQTYNMWSVWKS